MTNLLKKDKDFKEAIGSFIIAFSELEFGLVFLCSLTEFDIRKKDQYLTKYLGFPLDKKIQHLSNFIEEHLIVMKPKWDIIKAEIKLLNGDRRFLVHGFMSYSLPHETITTHVKDGGKVTTKNQTLEEINNLTKRLHQVNSGENGINGEFHTQFTKSRIDLWNKLVNEENKIIYKVNGVVMSE